MTWDARRLIRFYRDGLQWCGCGQPDEPMALLREAVFRVVDRHGRFSP